MKTLNWQPLTSLPAGGTISGISGELRTGSLWLCSPAGLFREKDGQFSHQIGGIPFNNASALLVSGKMILAAGFPNHVVRSADSGNTWFSCWTDQVASPVTCFAASDSDRYGQTLLAGSDGDGILRSTDGGSTWQLSNFGLRSFNIFDLACAPARLRGPVTHPVDLNYEVVFAATEGGVYQSPNAGRAWRFAGDGLPSVPVLSIAVSPDFHKKLFAGGAVFAGTDRAGLHRSLDGGKSWQAVTAFPIGDTDWSEATFNTLTFNHQGVLFAGTGEQGILASPDLGESWRAVLQIDDVVLRLFASGDQLLAGTADHGMLVSNDHGLTWQFAEQLSARQVNHLAALSRSEPDGLAQLAKPGDSVSNQDRAFLVAGVIEGIWANTDSAWRNLALPGSPGLPGNPPAIAMHASQNRFLVLTTNQLLASKPAELAWEILFETGSQFSALACAGDALCLGTLQGEIWLSPDGGKQWASMPNPFQQARIVTVQMVHSAAQGPALYVVIRREREGFIELWRAGGPARTWTRLFEVRTQWQTANLALLPPPPGESGDPELLLAVGTDLFLPGANGLRRHTIAAPESPVLGLWSLSRSSAVLLSKAGELMISRDRGATWEDAGLAGKTITALTQVPSDLHTALALTSAGEIFACDL